MVDTRRTKIARSKNCKNNEGKCIGLDHNRTVDWTQLSDDLVILIFSRLNDIDRINLSFTCRSWKRLGLSSSLWQSLDVRTYKFNARTAETLSPRCNNLSRLAFDEADSPQPIMSLRAPNLRELLGYGCKEISDSTLSVIVTGHPLLETLELGPDLSKNISSNAIRTIANCCPNLRKLKLSGISNVNDVAINALAARCGNLIDIGFLDCLSIDEIALGSISSLKFLSVAGSKNMNWALVANCWSKLSNLIGLDISRTNVDQTCICGLLSSSSGLRVLCAFDCPLVTNIRIDAKKFLYDSNDVYNLMYTTEDVDGREEIKVREWGFFMGDKTEVQTMTLWLECVVSHFMLSHYKTNPQVTSSFWQEPSAIVLSSLMKSRQEDVVEIGIETVSNLKIRGAEITVFHKGPISPIEDEVIGLLFYHSRSHKEILQLQATKAIARLLRYACPRKSFIRLGGIDLLSDLTKSSSGLVVAKAAKGFVNLSGRDNCQDTIINSGGTEALLEVLSKWSHSEDILVVAANALGNLARYEACAMKIVSFGGVPALLNLAFDCPFVKASVKALLAVCNISSHGKHDYAGIGNVPGVFATLVQLTRSFYNGIRIGAAATLSNLCLYEEHIESNKAAGVIKTFVALAQPGSGPDLLPIACNFFLMFSDIKENSIAIGEQGGIAAFIKLLRYDDAVVRYNAVVALCKLAFLPCNAAHVKAEEGVATLIEFFETTQSREEQFYSTLVLACMYDKRMVDDNTGEKKLALDHIGDFVRIVCDPAIFSFIATSPRPLVLKKQATALFITRDCCRNFSANGWIVERIINLLRNSSSEIKACAAFALVQLIASHNIGWINHTKDVQKAGGPKILRVLAASKAAPISVKVLSKVLLYCLDENLKTIEFRSSTSV